MFKIFNQFPDSVICRTQLHVYVGNSMFISEFWIYILKDTDSLFLIVTKTKNTVCMLARFIVGK